MGTALYITLEHEVGGVDASSVDGKGIAMALDALDRAAQDRGVQPLSAFISQSAAELDALAGDLGIDVGAVPQECWFAADGGLQTVRSLLGHARVVPDLARAIADLQNMERVLDGAAKAGERFHLAIDF